MIQHFFPFALQNVLPQMDQQTVDAAVFEYDAIVEPIHQVDTYFGKNEAEYILAQ